MTAERAALLAALDCAKELEDDNHRLRKAWAAVSRDLRIAESDLASLKKRLSELTYDNQTSDVHTSATPEDFNKS